MGRVAAPAAVATMAAWLGMAAGATACGPTSFVCQSDGQCSQGRTPGRCEADGYCSFPASDCPSGQRYGDLAAGGLAGTCVPEGEISTSSGPDDPVSTSNGSGASASSTVDPTTGDDTTGGTVEETDAATGTPTTSASTGATTGPLKEVCDDVDNDGDGLIDEWTGVDEVCNGCALEQREDFAYWFCDGPVIWSDALETCRALGADLASIHDAETNDYIVAHVPDSDNYLWVGGNDLDEEGTWIWSDGTPLDFENWATNQPDNIGDENCLHQRVEGLWNDYTCANTLRFACAAVHSP